jgi:hypothetical protein
MHYPSIGSLATCKFISDRIVPNILLEIVLSEGCVAGHRQANLLTIYSMLHAIRLREILLGLAGIYL